MLSPRPWLAGRGECVGKDSSSAGPRKFSGEQPLQQEGESSAYCAQAPS